MPQYILPGKAHEALLASDISPALRVAATEAERRNKGRGYRVFMDTTAELAAEAAEKIAEHIKPSASPVQIVAYRTAVERLGGVQPKAARQRADRDEGFHTFGVKLPNREHLKPYLNDEERRVVKHIERTFAGKIIVLTPGSPFYGQEIDGQREQGDYTVLRERYTQLFHAVEKRSAKAAA